MHKIRELLSDLIDVRNGEIPPAGASRLSESGVRADAESHLAACSECRVELAILEDIGGVYADFSVGELPAQHFSNYGQLVRQRMEKQDRKITPIRAGGTKRWWKAGAAAAAAACIAFAVIQFSPKKPHSVVARTKTPRTMTPLPTSNRATPINIFNDVYPASTGSSKREVLFNPEQPKGVLDQLQHDEGRYGYLVVGERVLPNEAPLLGLQMRTTRDEDRDLSNSASLGLRIHDIAPDSVANEMGLMRDDTIVCINGLNVNSGGVADAVHFITAINNLGKGAAITIDIVRQDKSGVLYIQRRGVLGEPKAVFE